MSQSNGIKGGTTDRRSEALFSVGERGFCWCSFDHFYMHKNIFKTLKEGGKTKHNRSPLKGDDMIMFCSKVVSAAPKWPKKIS